MSRSFCTRSLQTGYAFPGERDVAGFGVSGKSKSEINERQAEIRLRFGDAAACSQRISRGDATRPMCSQADGIYGTNGTRSRDGPWGRAHRGKEEKSLGATSQQEGAGACPCFRRDSFSGRARFGSADTTVSGFDVR